MGLRLSLTKPQSPQEQSAQTDPELKFWVATHRVSGIGPARFNQLLRHFGSVERAWSAPFSDLAASGIGQENARSLMDLRDRTDPDHEMETLENLGLGAVRLHSEAYPQILSEIYDPPPVLYLKGTLKSVEKNSVAVVGSRRCTAYGREMARRISSGLAQSGIVVYSGLARGIDGVAHRATLDAGGRTVAVVGGGLDSIYPAEHAALADEIVQHGGAVISEYPVGVRPKPEHFPRRNRVISGLTVGVVVVEATRKSGAMLTVKWALEQDREVFAVPGSALSDNSEGPNWLIQQGAKLTTSHMDVLDELQIEVVKRPETTEPAKQEPTQGKLGVDSLARKNNGTDIEFRVHRHLVDVGVPCHVDEVSRSLSIPVAEIASALTVLALEGRVTEVGPMTFVAK
jgi:DNA processing protein